MQRTKPRREGKPTEEHNRPKRHWIRNLILLALLGGLIYYCVKNPETATLQAARACRGISQAFASLAESLEETLPPQSRGLTESQETAAKTSNATPKAQESSLKEEPLKDTKQASEGDSQETRKKSQKKNTEKATEETSEETTKKSKNKKKKNKEKATEETSEETTKKSKKKKNKKTTPAPTEVVIAPTNTNTPTPAPTPLPSPTSVRASAQVPKAQSLPGVRPAFKEFWDTYEQAYMQYCDLLENMNSDDTLGYMADYLEFTETIYELDEMADEYDDEEDMSVEEYKYFVDVQARLLKRLGEVGLS